MSARLATVLSLLLVGCAPPVVREAALHRGRLHTLHGRPVPNAALPRLEGGLDDYVTYALLRNPGLRAAYERIVIVLERVPQVTALPDPVLRYAYFVNEVETRVGPQRHRLGLMQVFPGFGKRQLRGEVALAEADVAFQRYLEARAELILRVRDTWYELAWLGRAVAITRENLEIMKYIESVARSRYRVNKTPYADVLRAQVELNTLEDRLRTLEDMRAPLVARLNAALSRRLDAAVPWPGAIVEERLATDHAAVFAALQESNPELRALDAQLSRERLAICLAEKSGQPDYSLGLSYIETGSAEMDMSDSGKDPFIIEAGITLPLWRGKVRAAVREAEARLASTEQQLLARYDLLGADARLLLFKLHDAERRLALHRTSLIPKARQALKATETAYASAKADITDYLEAQRTLLAFRLEAERALADVAQRLAELERLVGRTLEREPPKGPAEGENP
ncbi:TolC family protein [bacterium]|nr:TolC family protein [bacterium]